MIELLGYCAIGFGLLTLGAFLGAAIIQYELSKDREDNK